MLCKQVLFSAIIIASKDKGVGNEDHLSSWDIDTSPERCEIELMSLGCNKDTFIEALLSSRIGHCFVRYRSGKIADIGGSSLSLEAGQTINIFSDFSVSN